MKKRNKQKRRKIENHLSDEKCKHSNISNNAMRNGWLPPTSTSGDTLTQFTIQTYFNRWQHLTLISVYLLNSFKKLFYFFMCIEFMKYLSKYEFSFSNILYWWNFSYFFHLTYSHCFSWSRVVNWLTTIWIIIPPTTHQTL